MLTKYDLLIDYFVSNGIFTTDETGLMLFDKNGYIIDPTLEDLEDMFRGG